jgi:hypothetical protein
MTFSNHEVRLHAAVMRYLRTVLVDCRAFHIPNGGKRSAETARLMKALGTMPGVFDIEILAPGPRTFWLECKSDTGRLSDEQESFRVDLIKMGFPYAVVRSLDDVRDFILQNGIPNRLSEQAARMAAA